MRRSRLSFRALLPAVAVLAISVPVADAQTATPTIPENAKANRYGGGWQCNPGFRRDGESCVAVKVPDNAYRTQGQYGSGWACKRGYRAEGERCVAVRDEDCQAATYCAQYDGACVARSGHCVPHLETSAAP